MTQEIPKYLLLGEVLRPHGIRGELRVKLLTAYPERINDLAEVYLGAGVEDETPTIYPVEHMRMNPPYGLLKLRGIRYTQAHGKPSCGSSTIQ